MGVPGLLLGHGAGYTGRDMTGMRLHTATQPFAMHVPSQTVPLEDLDEDQVEAARSDSAPSAKTVTTLQTVVFAIFLDPPHPPTHPSHTCQTPVLCLPEDTTLASDNLHPPRVRAASRPAPCSAKLTRSPRPGHAAHACPRSRAAAGQEGAQGTFREFQRAGCQDR